MAVKNERDKRTLWNEWLTISIILIISMLKSHWRELIILASMHQIKQRIANKCQVLLMVIA
jgi:hypothetical protein